MSPSGYLVGLALTAISVGALVYGAVGVRRRFFPQWTGALGALVVVVLAVAAADLTGELLGAVGLFDRWVVLPALVLLGAAAGVWARRGESPASAADPPRRGPPLSRVAVVVAIGIAGLVVAQWAAHIVATYQFGILDGDSTWYHLPVAANFIQSGSTVHALHTSSDSLVTYYPANSEITTALVILPFGRDLLVPLLNLGWLGLALLSGWCIGRRYGQAALGVAAVAVVASLPVMASTQAGTARNDVVDVALFLAAVAIVVHTSWDRPSTFLGGLATGLAVGVKLSGVVPAILVTVGVMVIAPRGRRKVTATFWLLGAALTGSYWYVRNLLAVGNPVPFLHLQLGPIDLPSALTVRITNTSIADRLGEPGAWTSVLRPGLNNGFGPVWIVVLVLWAGGVAIAATRDRRTRMLALVMVSATVAYILQPYGAPGHGFLAQPNFALNLRYITPIVALGLVLLCARRFWVSERFELAILAAFGTVVVVNQFPRVLQHSSGSSSWEWPLSKGDVVIGLVVALVALSAAVAIRALWRSHALALGVVVAGVGIGALVVGGWGQRVYFDHRYAHARPGLSASAAFPWAQRVGATRIAISGNIFQYPLTGPDLQTVVRYGGVEGPHGTFRDPRTACEWDRFLADGHFQYAVLAPSPLGIDPELAVTEPATQTLPGATEVLQYGRVQVFHLPKQIDLRGCP